MRLDRIFKNKQWQVSALGNHKQIIIKINNVRFNVACFLEKLESVTDYYISPA